MNGFGVAALHYFELSAAPHYSGWVGLPTTDINFQQPVPVQAALHRLQTRALTFPPPLPIITQTLWDDLRSTLPILSLELTEADGRTARYTEIQTHLIIPGQFSAAHRTYAPRLTEAENRALYGKCANLHGHNYQVEMALPLNVPLPERVWDEFDHVNLSTDIPDLHGRNVVTEALAELIARRAPVAEWVRVWELPDFFAEYHRDDTSYRLGRQYPIRATHGWIKIEVTVRGDLDPRTETAFDLNQLDAQCLGIIQRLRLTPSSPVETFQDLWLQLAERLGGALTRLRAWPTPHHQFIYDG